VGQVSETISKTKYKGTGVMAEMVEHCLAYVHEAPGSISSTKKKQNWMLWEVAGANEKCGAGLFFFMVLGFEHRALCLLSMCSTT
jgi:hypothetical protein